MTNKFRLALIAALSWFLPFAASAQTGQTYWRLDQTAGSPYKVQLYVNGLWYNFGQITSAGVPTPYFPGTTCAGGQFFSAIAATGAFTCSGPALLTVPGGGTGAASFTANLPLLGNGTSALTQGTRSGNTTKFATSSGTLTNGDCVSLDASGNYIDAGGPCTVGGGGGTVTAGTAKQLAYYAVNGNTVVGNATLTTDTVVASGGTTAVRDIPTWNNTTGTAIYDESTTKANTAPALVTSAQPSYHSGYLFRLTRMYSTVTPGVTHDHIFGEPSATVQPANHSFIGCVLCEYYESAAGTTAFTGTDGTNTPVLGIPGAPQAATAHMTAFGVSVVCQATDAVCVGRQATAKSSGDVILGSHSQDTVIGSGSNTLVGPSNQITAAGGQQVGLGNNNIFNTTGSQNLLVGSTFCTVGGAISNAIGIGRNACPSATGSVVVGGQFATKFYAGTESTVVPVYASGMVSQGTAPSTNFGTCTLGVWTGGPWAGHFLSSGVCATGGQYYWNVTKAPPNALACHAHDQTNPAVTIVPVAGTSGASIKLQVTSATGVANNDVIVVSCQGY